MGQVDLGGMFRNIAAMPTEPQKDKGGVPAGAPTTEETAVEQQPQQNQTSEQGEPQPQQNQTSEQPPLEGETVEAPPDNEAEIAEIMKPPAEEDPLEDPTAATEKGPLTPGTFLPAAANINNIDDLFESEQDKAILAEIRARASKKMTLPDAIGLAGIALTDPHMGQKMLQAMDDDKEQAQNVLANLAQNVVTYKKTALQQATMAARTQATIDAQLQRGRDANERSMNVALINQNASLISERMALLQSVPNAPKAPSDYKDSEATQRWLVETQPLVAEAAVVESAIAEFTDMMGKGSFAAPAAAEDAFKNRLLAAGIDEKQVEKYWGKHASMFKAIAAENQKILQQDTQMSQARINKINREADLASARAVKIEEELGTGGVMNVRNASQMVGQMANQITSHMSRRDALMKQEQRWLYPGDRYQGSEYQDQVLNEIREEIAAVDQFLDTYRPITQAWARRMMPYMDLLDFGVTYERMFTRTLEDIVESDPHYTANPQLVYLAVTTGPPGDPIKQEFWMGLFEKIRRQYPDISKDEVIQVLEEEAMEKYMQMNPAGKKRDPLDTAEETSLWAKAKPPQDEQTEEPTVRRPGDLQFTRGEKIRMWANGVFDDFKRGITGGGEVPEPEGAN